MSVSRFLDIIVPEYNCAEKLINRLLTSVNTQKNIDFKEIGILIVNDHSPNKLRKGIFRNYPKLNITYLIKPENNGQGMTRQYGIEHSEAKYITFMDQDDMFYSNDALSVVFQYLKAQDHDVFLTDFVEETYMNKQLGEMRHTPQDMAACHGLYCNRRYLIDNGYSFNPNVRFFEDTYFVKTLCYTSNCFYIPYVTYFWRHNETSQVRTKMKHEFEVEHFKDRILQARDIYVFLKNHHCPITDPIAVKSIYSLYSLLESNVFDAEDLAPLKADYEKMVYDFICLTDNCFNRIDEADRKEYYEGEIATRKERYRGLEIKESFDDFLKRLQKS